MSSVTLRKNNAGFLPGTSSGSFTGITNAGLEGESSSLAPLIPSREDSEEEYTRMTDMEQGLVHEGGANLKALIQTRPEAVIQYVQNKGVETLGAFKVQDSMVFSLLHETEPFLLRGSEHRDFAAYESDWRKNLDGKYIPKTGWSSKVEVEAQVVTIKNASFRDDDGLINPLLKRYKAGVCTNRVFGLDAVKAVILWKWNTWAKRFLLIELACYMLWLLSFNAFTLLFQDEDLSLSFKDLLSTVRGQATVACEIMGFVGMLPFLYIEACTIREYGLLGWITVWNIMDFIAYANQIGIAYLHIGRYYVDSEVLSVLIAFQILLLWFKIQYFARCFQPAKNAFVDILRAVIQDVKFFLCLLLLTMWGFSCAFYILFRKDQDIQEFRNIGHSTLTMFAWMLGGFSLDVCYNSHNPGVAIGLLLVYIFTMSMVLLNCLIAIMADAWTKVTVGQEERFLCGKAEIIDELESFIPASWMKKEWYPAYIHILKLDPKSADLVRNLTANDKADEIIDESKELKERIDVLSDEVAKLQRLIATLIEAQAPKHKEAKA